MKKKIIVVISSILIIFLLLFLYGLTLPAKQNFKASKKIVASPKEIWKVLNDWQGQKKWRDDLKKVEVIDDKNFLEYPKFGPPIQFEVLKINEFQFMELKLSHRSFSAIYQVQLIPKENSTLLEESYVFNYPSPMTRVFMPIFFDINDFSKKFLDNLEKEVLKKQQKK